MGNIGGNYSKTAGKGCNIPAADGYAVFKAVFKNILPGGCYRICQGEWNLCDASPYGKDVLRPWESGGGRGHGGRR